MAAGLHIVRKPRPGKPVIWYVYAWRGGPCIHRQEGGGQPKVTRQLSDAAADARREERGPARGTMAALIASFRASPQFTGLAPSTRRTDERILAIIHDKWGAAPLAAFEDSRMRGDVLAWRDACWADKPRTADKITSMIGRLCGWAVERGMMRLNLMAEVRTLYKASRADVIWEAADFAALFAQPECTAALRRAIELAAWSGLSRADLLALPWSAVQPNAIFWQRQKTGRPLVIPMFRDLRALLDLMPKAGQCPTVLTCARGKPWTIEGFDTALARARKAAGITKRLHDIRGTFATRAMQHGCTDAEIGMMLGWSPHNVGQIRARYVDGARVIVSIAQRLNRTGTEQVL
jgi:integrase